MPDYDDTEQEFLAHASPLPDCPPLEILLAAGQSVLPEEIEIRVAQHVATCRTCHFLLQDFESLPERALTAEESARIRRRIPVEAVRSPRRWFVPAAVAAAALVALTLVLVHPWRGPSSDLARQAPLSQQAQLPVQVALTRLQPDRELITGLVFRGGGHSPDEPDASDLEPAFAAYMKDHYDAAAQHFAKLAERYPKSDTPVLYLGVSQLFLGQNQAAFASLTQAEEIAKPNRRDAAAWYRSIAALRANNPGAGELFQSLCQRGSSSYSKKACTVWSQLHPEGSAPPDK